MSAKPWPDVFPADNAGIEAYNQRLERDRRLEEYDKRVQQVLRELRRATVRGKIEELEAEISALDDYATKLQDVPSQPGFPEDIVWPVMPGA